MNVDKINIPRDIREVLLKEWDSDVKELVANSEWLWETIRMYLTVFGFLLVAYNYLVYQFAIPYIQNGSADGLATKGVIIFVSLLMPILSVPLTWYILEIFEYRYRRFLDKAYTLNRLRKLLGIDEEFLNLYPQRYYQNIDKNHRDFVDEIVKRNNPPTFYSQGRKFIVMLEGMFLFLVFSLVVLLLVI